MKITTGSSCCLSSQSLLSVDKMGFAEHKMLLLVFVTTLFSSLTKAAYDRTVCDQDAFKAKATQNPGPSKPLLAPRFSLRIEANLDDYNKTIDIHEFYDFPGNRGSISQWDESKHTRVYFDYNTKEVLAVTYPDDVLHHDIDCEVTSLAAYNSSFIFGTRPFANGTQHIFSVGDSFRMAVTQPELYLGVLQTDGVIAEAWRACIYMDSLDATFNATWYFTANNSWTSTMGAQSPLWLEVTGRVGGANAHNFDHVYTFTEYKPGSVPATELETPPGVYCENRINTKPLPNITDNFSYRTEIVDTATKYINFMSEYYYLQMRVSEYEYQPETGSPYGSNPIRRLHDFRTGVAYIMDTVLGNCTVTPISKLSADATAADSVHVRMKNEREFFSFNNKFTYAGQRVARDIDCDVWVSVKDDWPANQPFETHWEWYFATAAWLELAGYQYEALLPVMLRITAQAFDPPFERIYHIYDYREGELNNRDFDISTCFNKTHRVEYIVTFPGNYNRFVAPSLTDFRDQFLVTTTSICQVSYLRVARTRVDYDSNNIYVSFSLLDQAPIAGDVQQSEPEASLQEAGDRLQSAISNGYFLVSVPVQSGQKIAQLKATKVSIGVAPTPNPKAAPPPPPHQHSLQQRAPRDQPPSSSDDLRLSVQRAKPSPKASSTSYSKGAVVGLAIVMLLVGYSFGVGLMLLAHRRLMHERAPAFLDNPLRELQAQNGKSDSSDADSEMMKEPSASQIGMDSHEPTGAASEHPYVNVSLES